MTLLLGPTLRQFKFHKMFDALFRLRCVADRTQQTQVAE